MRRGNTSNSRRFGRGLVSVGDIMDTYATTPNRGRAPELWSQVQSAVTDGSTPVEPMDAATRARLAAAMATAGDQDDEGRAEVARYFAALPELLVTAPAEWVVFRNGRVHDTFDNPDSALAFGRRTLAHRGFLVAQVVAPNGPTSPAMSWAKAPPVHTLTAADGRTIPGRWFIED